MRGRMTRSEQAGFTLVEVMVALAVLAVAMGAIIHAAGSHARYAAYLKEKTMASWVAANLVVEQQISSGSYGRSRQSGRQEMGGMNFYWRITPGNTAVKAMKRLDIEVNTTEAMDAPLIRLTAFSPG